MKNKHVLLATMVLSAAACMFSAANFVSIKLAKNDIHQFLQDVALVDVDEGEK